MLCEQTFLNAGPLLIKATERGRGGAALAGFAFNVLLIARAPLQLFQAIQTSILPHLTRAARDRRGRPVPAQRQRHADGDRRVRRLRWRSRCSSLGPFVMDVLFGGNFDYGRGGLVLVVARHGPLPVGRHAQPGGARARAGAAGRDLAWVSSAVAFALFLLLPGFDDRVLQVEIGYLGGGDAALCAACTSCYRRAWDA